MAAMVAFNLALALFPFALLILFVFGKVIESGNVEQTVINDLQGIFPAVEGDEVARTVDRIRDSSTTIGIAAAIGAIWIGASFWGAMDTAFCRIYHVECRSWLAQKRFALLMLLVVTLFLAASIVIPLAENLALSSSEDLPFGLDEVQGLRSVIVLVLALALTFGLVSFMYYVVPKGHVPWHGVWPGAMFVTVTTAIGNAVFPVYLTSISDADRIGGALGFILITLIWFYLLSLALLVGCGDQRPPIRAPRHGQPGPARVQGGRLQHEYTCARNRSARPRDWPDHDRRRRQVDPGGRGRDAGRDLSPDVEARVPGAPRALVLGVSHQGLTWRDPSRLRALLADRRLHLAPPASAPVPQARVHDRARARAGDMADRTRAFGRAERPRPGHAPHHGPKRGSR